MRRLLVVGLLVALTTQVLGIAVAGAGSGRGGPAEVPAADPARGVVVAGLAAATEGPCQGLLEVLDVPARACTHGPDPAPVHLGDVRAADWSQEDAQQTAAAASSFACDGDGTSGRRAHAIYAVAPDRLDRFATFEEAFRGRIAQIQDEVRQSSLLHGANQPLVYRFTHTTPVDGDCEPLLDRVVLPRSTDDDTFSATIAALQELGYTDSSRRYLVWVDANVLCGIATMYGDEDPSPTTNLNNRLRGPLFSRVDAGCWGYAETHELIHNIGGVQSGAPNSSGAGHCNDDYDIMCYSDGGLLSALRVVCGDTSWERRLDCRGDDYFHPAPKAGSYLDTHWNTADSGWLFKEATAPTPPTVMLTAPTSGTVQPTVAVKGTARDADADLTGVQLLVDGRRVATVAVPASGGKWSATVTLTAGDHTIAARVVDTGGRTATSKTVTVRVPAPPPPPPPVDLFVDDDDSIFEGAIEWLAAADITRGCNPPRNDRFCPDQAVTRGQMAAFLSRALDLPAARGVDFRDDNASRFEDAIERLAAADITRGCNPPRNDRFCPDQAVTRGQMAAFLSRALQG